MIRQGVMPAAGLGAPPAIAVAPGQETAQGTPPGVGHAPGAMREDLNLQMDLGADVGDLLHTQFAGGLDAI